jgi:hypothetical protein
MAGTEGGDAVVVAEGPARDVHRRVGHEHLVIKIIINIILLLFLFYFYFYCICFCCARRGSSRRTCGAAGTPRPHIIMINE